MKSLLILTIAACTIALAGPATAVQLFDFDAQAVVPSTIGESAEVYGKIVNGNAVDTPLPLDFDNFEYTIVITGLTLDTIGSSSFFSAGQIAIYQDANTPADWATPASFVDGTAILSGTVTTFQHTMLIGTIGNGQGQVDWSAGTRLNELAPEDQTGWPLLTSVNQSASYVEPGYTEMWDGKVEPSYEVVSTEEVTFSEIKALYR